MTTGPGSRIDTFCAGVEAWLERRRWVFLAGFSVLFFVSTWFFAAAKLLWYDEIVTEYLVGLPNMGRLVEALKASVDSQPPLLYLLTQASHNLFGIHAWSSRLPAILGFWVMFLCLFAIVRRGTNALYAAACVAFLPTTSAFAYAYEARPYGILMGLVGTSFLCWQRATRPETERRWLWLAGLFLSLAAAISTHYFAVLLWIPLGVGELVRSYQRKRIDLPVWAVMITSLAPLALYRPLMSALQSNIGTNYWARPNLGMIEDAIRSYVTLAFAPLLGAVILWGLLSLGKKSRGSASLNVPSYEVAAAVVLAALPVFGVAFSFATGGYAPRYTLPCIFGLAMVLVFLGYSRTSGSPVLGCAMLTVFMGWYTLKAPSTYKALLNQRGSALSLPAAPFDNTAWARIAEKLPLPVIATDCVFYLQLQYYAPASFASRLYYLADVDFALQYDKFTTGDKVMLASRPFFPTKVEDYKTFVASNPKFLVSALLTQPNWVLSRLTDEGATIKLLARQGDVMLFEVTTASQH